VGEDVGTAHPNEGMARGYSLSEMSDLQIIYLKESLDDTSTFNRVTWISNKKTLEPRDVMDRGKASLQPMPRFGLEPSLAQRVEKTIGELQAVLKKAAWLVPDKTNMVFQVDPHGALMPILRGASSLDELHIAWLALSKRMNLGQKYLDKYDGLYRASTASERPTSPVSTDAGLYDNFPKEKSNI
ncbi:hypothetical protein DFH09DRAFT_863932, partial [Mycena vulgaris]